MFAPCLVGPAVVVHRLAHARLALRPRRPVCLLSAPAAGRYAGAAWWRAMIEAARAEAPTDLAVDDVLDCADAPGSAMAALRCGQRILILDPMCPAFTAVANAAAALGAGILAGRPPSLDLARRHAERALGAWLGDSIEYVG